jgi:hypothetical protein
MTESTPVGPAIELPILDISNPEDPAAGKAILDAATKYGFLYVDSKGTDFGAEDVEKAFERVCYRRAFTYAEAEMSCYSRKLSSRHRRRRKSPVGFSRMFVSLLGRALKDLLTTI